MFLKQMAQPNGRIKLAIYESWREGKRTRQRTVCSLGYVDELIGDHPDPVAWGRALAEKMTAERKAERQAREVTIYPAQRIDKSARPVKNLGCALALSPYGALGIERTLRNFTRDMRLHYDINAVLRLLVCERLIDPGSKRSDWRDRDRYFFRCDFSDDDVYRALDVLSAAKDRIISSMNRAIAAAGIRDTSAVFYDVTNYYFEIDEEDGLRRKGVSKEHRPNPIVAMGLLQDANGIPLSFGRFPGNTNDSQTLIPTLEKTKEDFGLERVVVVADKGINCSDNIIACVAKGDGFVFSQSLKGTRSDDALRAWALDGRGWRNCGKNSKIKSMHGKKTVKVKACDSATGKDKKEPIDVKYVALWSKKYAERAAHKRAKAVEKAYDLIDNPSKYNRATSFGAAKYIKGICYDKDTGEILEARSVLAIDEDAIAADAAADGYYLIVTSETTWSDKKIRDTYRGLWKIEESFKVTKSELKCRPIFVWTPAHIDAHFLVCYIALSILRLLQYATGLCPSRIRQEMAALDYVNIDSNWWRGIYRSDDSDRLVDALGLEELKLKNLRTSDAKKILAKAAKAELPHRKLS